MARRSKGSSKLRGNKRATARKTAPVAQSPVALDSNKLKQLYSTMLRCRMIAEKARLLVKQGKLPGSPGTASGQEAAEVGALIDLLAEDCVAPGRCDLTARFIQGMPLKLIFAQLYAGQAAPGNGFVLPPSRGHTPRAMIVPAFALSAQLNLVTGVAWAARMHGKANVAVAFSGDDSASLGFWRDAVSFSAAHRLPIVHVVHNNAGDGSVSARLSLPGKDLATSAEDHGFPAFTVDGNDVVAVYRVVREAIRRARQGHGPALIECQTYRWCSQMETDSASHRPGTVELERSADPISRMEAYLEPKRLWSDKWKRKLVDGFSKKLDKAVEFAERSVQRPVDRRDPSLLATAS